MTRPKSTSRIAFSSEELLRQAIAKLLTKVGWAHDVRILHGEQEWGKDIVFRVTAGIGEDINCACVVKNGPISGSASSSAGARNVYIQVEQALDTPYTDGVNAEVQIERVYVMTPYPISQTALNSIRGKLKAQARRVVFVDGDVLMGLFAKFWPDFVADEQDAISRYLASATAQLEQNPDLRGAMVLYQLGGDEGIASKVYVDQ